MNPGNIHFSCMLLLFFILFGNLYGQTYSLDMVDSSFTVIEDNGGITEVVSKIGFDKSRNSGEVILGGNFPQIELNNLQIGYLGGNELGLDGDIVPYSSVTFDLGNNVSDEHWDQVVANTFVTYAPPFKAAGQLKFTNDILPNLMNVSIYTFNYKSGLSGNTFSTSELKKNLPQVLVDRDIDFNYKSNSYVANETEVGINYDAFIPILLKALQEQQLMIQKLSEKISTIENRL